MSTSDAQTIETFIEATVLKMPASRLSLHGARHWARVERNAVFLSQQSGISSLVPRLFAWTHDCQRRGDGPDTEHGPRAAEWLKENRRLLPAISDEDLESLIFACRCHTVEIHTDSIVAGICWDADRLDLHRLSRRPLPRFLNSLSAIELAESGDYSELNAVGVRDTQQRIGILHHIRDGLIRSMNQLIGRGPEKSSNYQL